MAKVSKNAIVKIGSESFPVKHDATTVQMGGFEAEPVMAGDGSVHHSETPVPGGASFTLIHMSTVRLAEVGELLRGTNTVTIEWDNGVVHTVGNAVKQNNLEVSNGECPVTVFGNVTIEQAG